MKSSRIFAGLWLACAGILAMLLTGCQSDQHFIDLPGMPTNAPSGPPPRGAIPLATYYETIHAGDPVIISFSGNTQEPPIPTHAEPVKEDGTITPPQLGGRPMKVAGMKPADLQRELQKEYDKKYRNTTVLVRIGDRYFHVDGEVNKRGPCVYLGQTDIVAAISSAAGFTEFANKKKVRLIHPNGKTEVINYNKAVMDPTYRFAVYPGDKIFVPRKFF